MAESKGMTHVTGAPVTDNLNMMTLSAVPAERSPATSIFSAR
jgi:hypothetical protein